MEEKMGTGRGRPGAASWTPSILFFFSPGASPGQGQGVMDVHRETGQQNAHFYFLFILWSLTTKCFCWSSGRAGL